MLARNTILILENIHESTQVVWIFIPADHVFGLLKPFGVLGRAGGPDNLKKALHSSHTKYTSDMEGYEGDFLDLISGAHSPYFHSLHALLDMFLQEWKSRNNMYCDVTWGYPYENGYNWNLQKTVDGINGHDIVNSAMPVRYMDIGLVEPNHPHANKLVTHAFAHCLLTKRNAPYEYVKYSGGASAFDDEDASDDNDGGVPGEEFFDRMNDKRWRMTQCRL